LVEPRVAFELAQPDAAATLQMQHRGSRLTVGVRPVVGRRALKRRCPPATASTSPRTVDGEIPRWSRGDIVRVRLEFDARQPMNWVVLDDPVPAGAGARVGAGP
jgi:hypothetical protein